MEAGLVLTLFDDSVWMSVIPAVDRRYPPWLDAHPFQQRVGHGINQGDRLVGTLFFTIAASGGARLVRYGYLQSTGNQSVEHEAIRSTNYVVPCTTT